MLSYDGSLIIESRLLLKQEEKSSHAMCSIRDFFPVDYSKFQYLTKV